MDLTREEAISLFREHWSDLAYTTDHSPADKEWFIRERGHKVRFNCYLCEYVKYYIGDYESCNTKCPVEWPKTTDSIKGTPCQRSYYGDWTSHRGEWMSCKDEEKMRELARLISQLPEKAVVNTTPFLGKNSLVTGMAVEFSDRSVYIVYRNTSHGDLIISQKKESILPLHQYDDELVHRWFCEYNIMKVYAPPSPKDYGNLDKYVLRWSRPAEEVKIKEKEKVKITIDEIAAWKGVEPDNIEIIDII